MPVNKIGQCLSIVLSPELFANINLAGRLGIFAGHGHERAVQKRVAGKA